MGGGLIAQFLRPERRTLTIADLDAYMDWQISGPVSATGLAINPDTAMASAVVYACVNVLAQTIASLPLIVYRRLPDGGKERAPEHRLYTILHDQPNPEMTAYEFRACLVGHVALWGNAYAEIERSDAGINALWPLRPDRMTLRRDDSGNLLYHYQLPKPDPYTGLSYKNFRFEQIMHWRGLSGNGIIGYSPIGQAAEAIGVDLATRQYGARFFGNDSRPGGILVHPKTLTDLAAERFKARWEQAHRGLSNAQRVAVLEEGVTWTQIGIPPEEAQFLETRKYERSEIAGLYRVPPHLIGDLERATFSNISEQTINFRQFCILPWVTQIEQAIKRDLFSISEGKRTHFAEHLIDELERADIQTRYQSYAVGRNWGWLSANDVRQLENMNPLPGEEGDLYLVPANMMAARDILNPPEPEPAPQLPAPEPEAEPGQENEEEEPE